MRSPGRGAAPVRTSATPAVTTRAAPGPWITAIAPGGPPSRATRALMADCRSVAGEAAASGAAAAARTPAPRTNLSIAETYPYGPRPRSPHQDGPPYREGGDPRSPAV